MHLEQEILGNKGYLLMECSHAHKYWGTWSVASTYALATHWESDDSVGDLSSASEEPFLYA